MQGIYKSFGANDVLQNVDFTLNTGEICALLGENGAGKSTLMNILGGVLQPDKGTIALDGTPVRFATPVDSLDAGIAFIHQELNLINDLTIYENMFLTHLKQKGVFLDAREMKRQTAELFERMNLTLDPSTMVRDLDASYKQIVEIARAMLQDASIIIMDEPTTSLTDPEIQRVFAMMRTLKEQGVGIVFISHKLNEVMDICDRFTVLRDGSMVAADKVSNTDPRQLAAHMVGHEVQMENLTREQKYGDEVLRLESLSDEKHSCGRGAWRDGFAGRWPQRAVSVCLRRNGKELYRQSISVRQRGAQRRYPSGAGGGTCLFAAQPQGKRYH